MAKAIAARSFGDDYQARWFWIQICRLFEDRSKVARVAYEHDNIKSLDDVVVYLADGVRDGHGNPLVAECYQVKFHVTAGGCITWEGLMDPSFINAASVSFLQRLKNAQQQYAPNGTECQFILYTPWSIDPKDSLAEVLSLTDGSLDWEKLARGGDRSKMGKIRAGWRQHLGLDDTELELVLRPLRIRRGYDLATLRTYLNTALCSTGLKPVPDYDLIHPYDELTRKLMQQGRREFTRSEIEEICKAHGLWQGHRIEEPNAIRLGIRSFLRHTEHLEDETDEMLDLLKYFDGRQIKASAMWQECIFPAVCEFLSSYTRPGRQHHLHLHIHQSIAFTAGYCLPSKAGVDIAPIQSTALGRQNWRPTLSSAASGYVESVFSEDLITEDGKDVALALSITHDIGPDVKAYVTRALPEVHRIVSCKLPGNPRDTAIQDGSHAKQLAQEITHYLKTQRTDAERAGRVHIFAAAPNGLLFFLGQMAHGFGRCVLYEYPFGSNTNNYQLSLAFPPPEPEGGNKEAPNP